MTPSRASSYSSSDDDMAHNGLFPTIGSSSHKETVSVSTAGSTGPSMVRRMFGESDEVDEEGIILDEKVIETMYQQGQPPVGVDDRHKYLNWYESTRKQLGDDESVFDLTQLDDYEVFMRQTELNDLIAGRLPAPAPGNILATTVGIPEDFEASELGSAVPNRPAPTYHGSTNKSESYCETVDFSMDDYLNRQTTADSKPDSPVYLQRSLKIRHLQMISFGGTLGVGLFLNSGKAINIAGGFGATLAFSVCGLIVLATLVSFCEMVTFVSVVDGVSGLSSRFVEDAFGFAAGWLYFLSFAVGLAGETVACVILLGYYPYLHLFENKGAAAGFVTLFLVVTTACNLMDIRVFGEIEYISSLLKLLGALGLIILMIVINVGGFGNDYIGFRYWDYAKSNFKDDLIYGLFRPSFNLHDTGTNWRDGIQGARGRFMSFVVALLVTSFAYSGSEIVCIAACEAKNPRRALPSATKRVFVRVIVFYILAVFAVSLNLYAGDPRLLRFYSGNSGIPESQMNTNVAIQHVGGNRCGGQGSYAGFGSGSQSPWNIALQSVNQCTGGAIVNGFLVYFALSCANAQIYVSSRTIYSLALQGKAPKFLTKCNRYGIPFYAVLFSSAFGLFAYICVNESATVSFQNLTSVISSSGILVWFAMCLSYLRFYYGLKRRPDIIGRDDKEYPYKSPLQPYTAYFGLIGSSMILLCMGYVVFLSGQWDTWFFFSSYGTLIVFVVLYLGYKIVRGSRIPSLDRLDFDTGRTEMDRYLWDKGREYNGRNFADLTKRFANWLA